MNFRIMPKIARKSPEEKGVEQILAQSFQKELTCFYLGFGLLVFRTVEA
jgi:hypothetical protein